MTKRDANDAVKDGIALDPSTASEAITLVLDARNKCAGLDLDLTDKGVVRTTQKNAVTLIAEHPRWRDVLGVDVRHDMLTFVQKPPAFAGSVDLLPRTVTDTDETAITAWLCQQTGADFPIDKVRRAMNLAGIRHAYDPVVQELQSFVWDGQSRLDDWLSTYLRAVPTEYTRMVGPKFMISCVARAFSPGCQADHMLVLEGEQDIGKSTAVLILAGSYYRDDLPKLGTRDAKEYLLGAWIIEFPELDALNGSEVTTIKAFLSQRSDSYRAAYEARTSTHKRRVAFIGTTNEEQYLVDHTGNRRFWPVRCGRIDLDGLERDRAQLWAEAVVRFNRGEPWWPQIGRERDLAKEEQRARVAADPWQELIADRVAGVSRITVQALLDHLKVPRERQAQKEMTRVAHVLQCLGMKRAQARVDGRPVWFYVWPSVDDSGRTASPLSPVAAAEARRMGAEGPSAISGGDAGDTDSPVGRS